MSETKRPKISLKKLAEFNTVWHEQSALVFKSNKELVVVGKLVNKKIVRLTENDIADCENFRFKYEIIKEEEVEEEETDGSNIEEPEAEEAKAEEPEAEETEAEETEAEEAKAEETKAEEAKAEEPEPDSEPEKPAKVTTILETKSSDFIYTINNLKDMWEATTEQNTRTIYSLENELEQHTSKIYSLEIELENKKKDFVDLQDLYDKMKLKFDGIKQLFSL